MAKGRTPSTERSPQLPSGGGGTTEVVGPEVDLAVLQLQRLRVEEDPHPLRRGGDDAVARPGGGRPAGDRILPHRARPCGSDSEGTDRGHAEAGRLLRRAVAPRPPTPIGHRRLRDGHGPARAVPAELRTTAALSADHGQQAAAGHGPPIARVGHPGLRLTPAPVPVGGPQPSETSTFCFAASPEASSMRLRASLHAAGVFTLPADAAISSNSRALRPASAAASAETLASSARLGASAAVRSALARASVAACSAALAAASALRADSAVCCADCLASSADSAASRALSAAALATASSCVAG